MIKDLIKKIKEGEKENIVQNTKKTISIIESKPNEYIKLGAIKPNIYGEIKPVPSEFPTIYCIQSKYSNFLFLFL